MDCAGPSLRRLAIRVTGSVQGVGFRPFVFRLAKSLDLVGSVRNDSDGVWIEAEGSSIALTNFLQFIQEKAPPLARIVAIHAQDIALQGDADFKVEGSRGVDAGLARIPPDAGICGACVQELFESTNRRHLYPFIACCDCGPRYTMTRSLPYDRQQTAMSAFPLCAPCAREYQDPMSRRFHAEPTACADCGPQYSVAVDSIIADLKLGKILAIKGVGGFHLVCDAHNAEAVERLRVRKERSGKPFAVMVQNLASAERFCVIDSTERAALASAVRPILLAKRRHTDLACVAPGIDSLGVMLPSTGLHWLIFHALLGKPTHDAWIQEANAVALVCTSANRGGEPLIVSLPEAMTHLADIADGFVDHNRWVVARADDPVVRRIAGAVRVLRRGRGQAPEPIALKADGPVTIGLGAHLKASVCVSRGQEAFLSHHVGDLDDAATRRFHRETLDHLLAILNVQPEAVACDLHPDFHTTHMAHALDLRVVGVQHHHAHLAACAAEHGVSGPCIGLALDGYGYGEDGAAWGGEALWMDGVHVRRLGGLSPLPQPGGERAAREPWRVGAAVLHALGRSDDIARRFGAHAQSRPTIALLNAGRLTGSSAAGRYFDAAAALLGVCDIQAYEAEAPMRLEALADGIDGSQPEPLYRLRDGVLDFLPLFAALVDLGPSEGARLFHAAFADGLAALAAEAAETVGVEQVLLSGGCLANRLLAERLCVALRHRGLTPLLHRDAPPGDGGVALGQAMIARAVMTA